SSDGITLRHLAFQTSIEAASISNSNSPTSFENCVFSGTSPGSLFIDTSDGCILQNCVFEGLVLVDASANCIIDGCEFYSNLSISDARNIRVLNNNLSSETSSNDQLGIVVMAGDLGQALFANNLVSSSIASPMYISNCDCDPNENIEVFNNIFTSESDLTSILLNNATRVQLIYNTVRADAGIALSVLGSSDIQVINNVLESETSNAAEFSDSSLQIVVRNNIFHSETSTGVQGYDSVEDFNSDPEQVAFDNIGIDPMLDDAGHFITNQEALGFALALTDLTTDFYGDLRDSVTPTCGAIETSFTGDTPGDFNGDGIVGAADLLVLLSNIGCTGDCGLADLDGDGVVGIGDLLILLGLI
ncbi:MAG: right-handed parallel beta-helix repeat-containing protein, partial [Flavobacteriales bacterium]